MEVEVYQVKPKGHFFPVISWLIRLVQMTPYSHYSIGYNDGIDDMTVDASSNGVRDMLRSTHFTKYHLVNTYKIKLNCQPKDFLKWLNKYKGKDYSALQNLGLLLKLIKLFKSNPFGRDSNRLICTELVLLMLEKFKGIGLTDSDNYDLIDTEYILERMEV